ncbi:hypothetical protein UPYG_G00029060 [Umbra pygmaea]|uniref:Transposase domain-containing protein n=1 Tax=Umbra pygmaea TaxID=75934 RepID=A0ABD0XMC3_UMBPY
MSSYWSKRRRILKHVQDHLQELAAACTAVPGAVPSYSEEIIDGTDGQTTAPVAQAMTDSVAFESCTDCPSTEEDIEEEEEDFGTKLAEWAVDNRITHNALSQLLKILAKDHPGLPKHPRTLVKTKTEVKTTELLGGTYHHSGIEHGILTQLLELEDLQSLQSVSVQINVDGLPLYKSSNAQFWPILGLIERYEVIVQQNKLPFLIGIYYGKKKPNSLQFLDPFVAKAQWLQREGIEFEGTCLPFKISAFICDTPARALVKNVKGHSGYYGCDKCTQRREYHLNRMTFPQMDAILRSDNAVPDDLSEDSHLCGETPLALLAVGIVSQFPLDYMHLVCLGVTRKLLHLWLKGPLARRLAPTAVKEISSVLLTLRAHVPCEFNRKPRTMDEVERWKATEFRQFLLYTGPVSLKGLVSTALYNFFMLLSVAMTILLSVSLCADHADYADSLLVVFVDHCKKLYGQEQLSYNAWIGAPQQRSQVVWPARQHLLFPF